MAMYARYVHAIAAWAFVLAIGVQVFLAGMFSFGANEFRSTHVEFGYTAVGLATLVLLVTALLARPGRSQLGWVTLAVALYVVQTILPLLRTASVAIAALHPVNALLLFGVAVIVARRAMAAARGERQVRAA